MSEFAFTKPMLGCKMSMVSRAKPLAAYRTSVNARAESLPSHKESMGPIAKPVAGNAKWIPTGAKPISRQEKSISLLRNRRKKFKMRLSSFAESIAGRTIDATALPDPKPALPATMRIQTIFLKLQLP